MVAQNEICTAGTIYYSADMLNDLQVSDQLALAFFATARCASFKQAARDLNVGITPRCGWISMQSAPCKCFLRRNGVGVNGRPA